MNFREKFIAEYLNKIESKKYQLDEKELKFFENVKERFRTGKQISNHQYNWLKDIADSLR